MYIAEDACLHSIVAITMLLCIGDSVNSHSQTAGADHSPMDALIEQCRSAQRETVQFSTSFTVTAFAPRPFQSIQPRPDERVIERRTFDISAHEPCFHVQEQLEATPDGAFPAMTLRSVWNGNLWWSEGGRGTALHIKSHMRPDFASDCWAPFHGIELMSFLGLPLPELLSTATVIDAHWDECSVWLRLSLNEEGTALCELELDRSELVWIRSARLLSFGAAGMPDAGKLLMEINYDVEQWGMQNGRILPMRARKETLLIGSQAHAARRFQPQRNTIVLERHAAAFQPSVADTNGRAILECREGVTVVDETLRYSYRIGQNRILIDGLLFETEEPIIHPPREGLPQTLRRARRIGSSGTATRPASSSVREFYVAESAVALHEYQLEEIVLVALSDNVQVPPPTPRIDSPLSVLADFGRWQLVYPRGGAGEHPARWQAIVRIMKWLDDGDAHSSLRITLDDRQAYVNLNGKPWRTPG